MQGHRCVIVSVCLSVLVRLLGICVCVWVCVWVWVWVWVCVCVRETTCSLCLNSPSPTHNIYTPVSLHISAHIMVWWLDHRAWHTHISLSHTHTHNHIIDIGKNTRSYSHTITPAHTHSHSHTHIHTHTHTHTRGGHVRLGLVSGVASSTNCCRRQLPLASVTPLVTVTTAAFLARVLFPVRIQNPFPLGRRGRHIHGNRRQTTIVLRPQLEDCGFVVVGRGQ